jgi:hypothetical protein
MGRNCPTHQSVHASGSKPPGKATFNIEPIVVESSEEVEILDSLPIGAISIEDDIDEVLPFSFRPLAEWREHYPYWQEPGIKARKEIGDCLAMIADAILTTQQPFPGDEFFDRADLRPELRFRVVKGQAEYIIHDYLVQSHMSVTEDLLKRPQFDISHWYARTRSLALALGKTVHHHCPMGHAVGIVAAKLLMDGADSHYPAIHPAHPTRARFQVYPSKKEHSEEHYTVLDRDLKYQCYVPKSLLENPTFDLVEWYSQYLDERSLFRKSYSETHLLRYPADISLKAEFSNELEDLEIEFEFNTDVETESGDDDLPDLIPLSDSEDEGEDNDDLPDLIPLSDSEDEDEDDESDAASLSDLQSIFDSDEETGDESDDLVFDSQPSTEAVCQRVQDVLTSCQPFPGDGIPIDP